MKEYFTILMTVLCLYSFSVIDSNAQTFSCTDFVIYGDHFSPSKQREMKKEALGAIAIITFYDNSIRLVVNTTKERSEEILDKISSDTYSVKIDNQIGVVHIKRSSGKIISLDVLCYEKSKLLWKMIFKRINEIQ